MSSIPTQFTGVTVVTKANVYFDGNVISPKLTYSFVWDTNRANGNVTLLDSWAQYQFNPDWALKAGQFKASWAHERDVSGQTAAVDAHYDMALTWDMYKNVFGRNGIDDQGTSTMAIVHDITGGAPAQAFPMLDNAYWSPAYFGMVFGDGSYPLLPEGLRAVTELDVTGHELSHGVCFATAAPRVISSGRAR